MIGTRAEVLGRLLYEFESKHTIKGSPTPNAEALEQSDWYAAVAQQMLEALDGPMCAYCGNTPVWQAGKLCEGCQ